VIRVIDQAGVFVQKDGLRFLEGDAVLHQVGLSLAAIPGKLDIAHGIILAISGQPPGAKTRTAERHPRIGNRYDSAAVGDDTDYG
jgi:hypothetical protein